MDDLNSHFLYSRYAVADDAAFATQVSRRLLAYWREKAAGRAYPAWTDLNLMDIYDIAPSVMVRDVVGDGADFRCRFCGTGLVSVLGKDPTGKLLDEAYQPSGRDMMLERYRYLVEAAAPVRVVGYVRVVETNLPTGFEGIMLPLADAVGGVGHIILSLDFSYDPKPDGLAEPIP